MKPPSRAWYALCALALCAPIIQARQSGTQEWRIPPGARMITSWGRSVTPENVHREYPRPQLTRKAWMNLNGLWQYAVAAAGEKPPVGRELSGRILVPFPAESALSGVMKSAGRLWYRRTFEVPDEWRGKRLFLNFGAVDWEAAVYVNGKRLGSHRGGYDPFGFDITDSLKPGKVQELIVGVNDPTDAGEQPRGKQVRSPGGIWYTSSTGIWQTVWLEPLPSSHISDIEITPDPANSSFGVSVHAVGATTGDSVRVTVSSGGTTAGSGSARAGAPITVAVPGAHLWSPRDPFLYDMRVTLERNGRTLDEAGSYAGMRSISLGKDERGITRILLNGTFLMQVGPLDQGFWPDGLYTPPSDEAMKSDIATMKRLGFNMARKHVKVEPERWYYWADRLGLLVWQDMPSGNNRDAEGKTQFEAELERLIATHINHPSIIIWVVFNEGWGQFDTERLTALVKKRDPSRLVNDASGWDDRHAGDLLDIHSYPKPKSPKAEASRAIVLGEFGGLGLAIPGHTWKKEHWGYQGMENREELTSKYASFMQTVFTLKDDPGLSAAVYTQLTDVEIECNGLMTYDRAVVKPDAEKIAAVNGGDFSGVPPP
ncbi:MAG TPA: glycoside hydrolase family 2 TIM barrel-domain containing protein, partial [Bacteroidota bacterium]|nr:glycoside hydrolase family 2 TIM barrel-domain containing protein [Bacteroidota bacterium]